MRSANYPDLNHDELARLESSWRYLVKNELDTRNYIDWDLLGDLSFSLEENYTKINEGLSDYFDLSELPNRYLVS